MRAALLGNKATKDYDVKVIYSYTAETDDEVDIFAGDIVHVLQVRWTCNSLMSCCSHLFRTDVVYLDGLCMYVLLLHTVLPLF